MNHTLFPALSYAFLVSKAALRFPDFRQIPRHPIHDPGSAARSEV